MPPGCPPTVAPSSILAQRTEPKNSLCESENTRSSPWPHRGLRTSAEPKSGLPKCFLKLRKPVSSCYHKNICMFKEKQFLNCTWIPFCFSGTIEALPPLPSVWQCHRKHTTFRCLWIEQAVFILCARNQYIRAARNLRRLPVWSCHLWVSKNYCPKSN